MATGAGRTPSYGDLALASANDSIGTMEDDTSCAAVDESLRAGLQRWILSLAVVNFDLELGPDVESMYPPLDISKEEKDNIAFSSFPDTAVFGDGSLVFSWRVREVPLHESHAAPPHIQEGLAAGKTRTRTVRRTSALLSRHGSLRTAGRAARTFLGRSAGEAGPAPAHTSSRSTSYLYGYTFFLQKRDASIRRGYFQKSVVILTHLPYVALFNDLVAHLGPLFFEHGMPVWETFVQEVAGWPAPTWGATLALPHLGRILTTLLPHGNEAQNGDWARAPTSPAAPPGPLLASVPQTPLLVVFRTLLPDLWLMWECMLLAEPMLVVGRDPRSTSEAVWHLVDLVRPVVCAGDFRPYFHIHDYDFKALVARNKPQAGTVLGATNPFFLQTCMHWPHILKLDGEARGDARVPGRTAAPAADFASARKRHVSKDRVLLKEMQTLVDAPHEHRRADAVLRRYFADLTERFLAPLNRYMASLVPATFDLSSPADVPRIQPFNQAAFLASLKTHNAPLRMRQRSLSTASSLRHALYTDFLQCPNFSLWLQGRIAAAEAEQRQRRIAALINGDVHTFGRTRSEVETVDLYMRLLQEIRAMDRVLESACPGPPSTRWRAAETEVATPHASRTLGMQRAALQSQLDTLVAAMSDDLQRGLEAKRDTLNS